MVRFQPAGVDAGGRHLLVFSGQDETLITQHTLLALDLASLVWASVDLPHRAPTADTVRASRSVEGGPIARIDGAGAALPHVGLVIFGGVKDNFDFVPPADAFLLRHAADVEPRRAVAAPWSEPKRGPGARACLGLCADGLKVYAFGGFDGESDLHDLWCLDLSPSPPAATAAGAGAGAAGAATAATAGAAAGPPEFDADLFKARRAHATAVLHSTAAAAGHNSIGLPIHYLVGAACAGVDNPAPDGTARIHHAAALALSQHGLGDGLSRGQRSQVISAFQDGPP